MTWLQRYRVREFVRNSVWFGPVLGMVVALLAIRGLVWLDRELGWESQTSADTVRAVLGTLAASMFTLSPSWAACARFSTGAQTLTSSGTRPMTVTFLAI